MKLFIIKLIILLVICSCNNKSENYYPVEIKKIDDTLRMISYYNDTLIRSIKNLSPDTLSHGVTKYFYKDGSLEMLIPYENDKQQGNEFWYYPSGNLKKKFQWHQDTPIYEIKEYYDLSRPTLLAIGEDTVIQNYPSIKTFEFLNDKAEKRLTIKYDSLGNIENVDGHIIAEGYMDNIPGTVGDTFRLQFKVATPPYVNSSLSISKNQNPSTIVEIDKDYNIASYYYVPEDTIDDKF